MTLEEGIKRAEDRGDWQMYRWLSSLQSLEVENKDFTRPIPCWKYVRKNTWGEQLQKVHSELGEVVEALFAGDTDHAAEEMTDTITALTTMLEIIGYGKERRAVLQARVNMKNRQRGYWADEDER